MSPKELLKEKIDKIDRKWFTVTNVIILQKILDNIEIIDIKKLEKIVKDL